VTVYGRVGVPMRGPKPVITNQPRAGINWYVDFRNGSLPGGRRLDSADGSIYGTATETWNGSFRYQAQMCCDGYYGLGVWSSLIVTPGPKVVEADVTVPTGIAANVPPNATGFAGQVRWTGANLPPGMGVDVGTGALVGVPTTPGAYANVTVTGTETTLPPVGPNDPKPPYPSATSNPFTVTVTSGPYITGVADQTRIIGQPFDIKPVANGFAGAVTWRAVGALPDGVEVSASTGAVSGGATKYGVRSVQLVATDGAGASATSNPFKLTVTDRNGYVPPEGSAVWTWGEQVCTYGCGGGQASSGGGSSGSAPMASPSGGGGGGGGMSVPGDYTVPTVVSGASATCSGRQLQHCRGEGCEAGVRGCDAPYSGGDTSFPVGTVAVSCINPSLEPSQGFCPKPTTTTNPTEPTPTEPPPTTGGTTQPAPAATWYYRNYYRQTKHTNGFIVSYYALTCYAGSSVVDNAQCGTPPTSIGQCMVNGYGVGTCGSGVAFTDGITQTSFTTNTSNWFD
jgi:hypothetical protein